VPEVSKPSVLCIVENRGWFGLWFPSFPVDVVGFGVGLLVPSKPGYFWWSERYCMGRRQGSVQIGTGSGTIIPLEAPEKAVNSARLSRDGDSRLSKDVNDLSFAETGSVVLKSDLVFLFVHVDAAQAVGIGEFSKALQLLPSQRRLEFIADFKKCHAVNYSALTSQGHLGM
jgi:hypothetical protein